ncbi:TIGR03086 family metal-binding protein [Streptomyces triculaminicus]|uniref:TIGR03086 family metal-binding protein n=1 Tax=Streptomyces triculaminicus TaxID=2816232 RepID=UPI0037CDEB9A
MRTLRLHLLGWLDYFQAALADPAGDVRPDPEARVTGDRSGDRSDDSAAVIGKLTATLRAALDDAVATRTVNVPRLGGAYPGSAVIDLLLVEVLGHGWDLARATGLSWRPDPAASVHALAILQAIVKPEYRGPGLPFGLEVVVSDEAPALDRLVAFTGRDPGWTPRGDLPGGSL